MVSNVLVPGFMQSLAACSQGLSYRNLKYRSDDIHIKFCFLAAAGFYFSHVCDKSIRSYQKPCPNVSITLDILKKGSFFILAKIKTFDSKTYRPLNQHNARVTSIIIYKPLDMLLSLSFQLVTRRVSLSVSWPGRHPIFADEIRRLSLSIRSIVVAR